MEKNTHIDMNYGVQLPPNGKPDIQTSETIRVASSAVWCAVAILSVNSFLSYM